MKSQKVMIADAALSEVGYPDAIDDSANVVNKSVPPDVLFRAYSLAVTSDGGDPGTLSDFPARMHAVWGDRPGKWEAWQRYFDLHGVDCPQVSA